MILRSFFVCLPLLVLTAGHIFCQEMRFSGGVGYGSYSMKELKNFQKSISYQSGVPLSIVQSFPSYYNWFIGGEYVLQPHAFGLKINGQTTGGRSTYSDYSGRVDLDMIISETAIGPTYKYNLLKNSSSHFLSLGGEAYVGFSQLEIHETIEVYEHKDDDKIVATNTGFALLPNIHYRFQYKFAHVGIQFGYWIGLINGPFKYKGNAIKYGNDALNPCWSGYRVRFEIGLGEILKNR